MNQSSTRTCAVLAFAVLALGGCGKPAPDATAPAAAQSATDESIPMREVEPAIDAAEFQAYRLTAADLDTYEKGLTLENDRLREAVGKSGAEGMNAFVAALPEQTEPAAAAALGTDVEHYRSVKQAVHDVLTNLETQDMLARAAHDAQAPADDAAVDESVTELQKQMDDPYGKLDAGVAAAFKARAERIKALRAENVALLFKAGA